MNKKGPVILRQKPIRNGGFSLYLDYYKDGRRHCEYLKLYLKPAGEKNAKDHNAAMMEVAQTIQAKRIIEIEQSGIITDTRQKFTDYARTVIEQKRSVNEEYARSLEIALERWVAFAGEGLPINKITPQMLREFGVFLKTECINRHDRRGIRKSGRTDIVSVVCDMHQNGYSQRAISRETGQSRRAVAEIIKNGYVPPRGLSDNCIRSYFDKIGTFLERASRDGVIPHNPFRSLLPQDKPRTVQAIREFLTLDELKRLAAAPCRDDSSKRLFMFCCFTGLRFSDAQAVTWADVDSRVVHRIMQKTQRAVTVPLSDNALRWVPERGGASLDDTVFTNLRRLTTINDDIRLWAKAAGINKDFSFHTSRHTFATLALTYGADLYTVSKLLGHSSITTTQVYAKIVDSKKNEAVNLIPKL